MPQSQQEMNRQADRDWKAADALMNRAYKDLMALENKHGQALLREAQRAWLRFRDANARYEASGNEGGSIYPMVYAGSLRASTDARTKELRDRIKEFKER